MVVHLAMSTLINYQGKLTLLYDYIPTALESFASPPFRVNIQKGVCIHDIVLETIDFRLLADHYLNLVCYRYIDCASNNFLTGRSVTLMTMLVSGGEITDRGQFIDRILSIVCHNTTDGWSEEMIDMVKRNCDYFFDIFSTTLPFEGQSPISLLNGYFERKQQNALNIKYVSGVQDNTNAAAIHRDFPLDDPYSYTPGHIYRNPRVISNTHIMDVRHLEYVDKRVSECFMKSIKIATHCIHGIVPLSLLHKLERYWSFVKIMALVEDASNSKKHPDASSGASMNVATDERLFNLKLYHDRCVGRVIHTILAQEDPKSSKLAIFYSSFVLNQTSEDERIKDLYRTRYLYMEDTKSIDPIPKDPTNALIYMVNDIRNKVAKKYNNVLSKSRHRLEGPLISVASERGIHHMTDKKIHNTWFSIQPGVVYTLLNWPQTDNLHSTRNSIVMQQSGEFLTSHDEPTSCNTMNSEFGL